MMSETLPETATEPTETKLRIIGGNTLRHLVTPLGNFIVAYLVISTASTELWGAFAVRLVIVTLAVHLLAWGNHEYLLRAFSREPGSVGRLWRGSLMTRGLFLTLVAAGAVVVGLRGAELGWTVLWLAAALVHQSLQVVVLYTRRFGVAVVAELAGLAVTAGLVIGSAAPDVVVVIRAVALGVATRAVVGLAVFARDLVGRPVLVVDRRHLVETVPFVLTGLAGLLVSKTDLMVVSAALGYAEVGTYQVVISFFIAIQSLSAVAFTPFVRDFYRSTDTSRDSRVPLLLAAGVTVAGLAIPAGRLVLGHLYGLEVSWLLLVMGALYAVPVFGYLPMVYSLYRDDRESEVVVVGFAGAAVNLVLTVASIRMFGIEGALAAAAVSQWVIWGWYLAKTRT